MNKWVRSWDLTRYWKLDSFTVITSWSKIIEVNSIMSFFELYSPIIYNSKNIYIEKTPQLLLCCDYWFRVSTMRSIPHHSMIRDFLEPHFCVSYEWFYCQGPHPQHPVMWDLHHIPIVMDQKLHSFFTLIRPIRSPLGIFLHTVFLQWPMVPHRWCTFLSRILVFTCMIWFVGFLIQKVLDRRWLHAVDLRLVIFHNPSKKTYS